MIEASRHEVKRKLRIEASRHEVKRTSRKQWEKRKKAGEDKDRNTMIEASRQEVKRKLRIEASRHEVKRTSRKQWEKGLSEEKGGAEKNRDSAVTQLREGKGKE